MRRVSREFTPAETLGVKLRGWASFLSERRVDVSKLIGSGHIVEQEVKR